MNNANQLLRTEGICKQFGSVLALSPLDFALSVGEVRALVGENGAGKSTLVRILTGAIQPSAGRMWLRSEPVQFQRPKDAEQRGIGAVHQEVPLLELRSVAENVYFGQEPCRFGFIQRRRMLEGTRAALNQLGTDIDPGATVRNLNAAQRQMVSLARSLVLGAKLLVLDEPTSSLSTLEVAVFLGVVRRLQAR